MYYAGVLTFKMEMNNEGAAFQAGRKPGPQPWTWLLSQNLVLSGQLPIQPIAQNPFQILYMVTLLGSLFKCYLTDHKTMVRTHESGFGSLIPNQLQNQTL